MRSIKLVAVLSAVALAVPVAAYAASATKNGITVVSPKNGGAIAKGKRPTFTFKVVGEGKVWVHVCKSRKRSDDGVICSDESIGRGVKGSGSTYTYQPKLYNYPDFWLMRGGTYYWQAFRIHCGENQDCDQEGPITKVVVR